jgi:hypothetical protein
MPEPARGDHPLYVLEREEVVEAAGFVARHE